MNLPDDPVTESAKAAQEVAKTTSKGIDAVRDLGRFFGRFVGGPIEQITGIVTDKLVFLRWERQQRFMVQAANVQQELGLAAPDRAVPLKIAIPLFQGASIEEDDDLQDLWTNLLINAAYTASGIEVKRAYVEILSQLSPLEAQILDVIYALPFAAARHDGVLTHALPHEATVAVSSADEFQEPGDEVQLAIANLARIGCLRIGMSWGGGEFYQRVNPTLLGRYFVQACRVQIAPPT